MRTFLIALVVLLICVATYAYKNNPQGCGKLENDLEVDLPAVLTYRGAPSTNAVAEATSPASVTSASSTDVPTVVAPEPPPPMKKWSPPAAIPAQDNWTWTTVDGQTYSNVTINKIEPDAVSITHSMGVARIDTSTLPADIQKLLNYDPDAAAAARAEAKRQEDHPYYTMAQVPDAEAAANQTHKPLAWVSSYRAELGSNAQDEETRITNFEMDYLRNKAIVIFIDANNEMGQTPAIVHHQYSQRDDDGLSGPGNYFPPKIVFSSPDATVIFNRVWFTEVKMLGAQPIDSALNIIHNDPSAQAILNGQPTDSAPAAAAPAVPPSAPAAPAPATASTPVSGTE